LEAKLFGPALQGDPQFSEVLAIDGERACHVTIVTDSLFQSQGKLGR
jgi:hypothetical protein